MSKYWSSCQYLVSGISGRYQSYRILLLQQIWATRVHKLLLLLQYFSFSLDTVTIKIIARHKSSCCYHCDRLSPSESSLLNNMSHTPTVETLELTIAWG